MVPIAPSQFQWVERSYTRIDRVERRLRRCYSPIERERARHCSLVPKLPYIANVGRRQRSEESRYIRVVHDLSHPNIELASRSRDYYISTYHLLLAAAASIHSVVNRSSRFHLARYAVPCHRHLEMTRPPSPPPWLPRRSESRLNQTTLRPIDSPATAHPLDRRRRRLLDPRTEAVETHRHCRRPDLLKRMMAGATDTHLPSPFPIKAAWRSQSTVRKLHP